MKKSVFGVTDSMSRFTGSLGKGISAATMDKNFQDRRRINMTRNKPTHAMYGVTQGVGYFGTSVASGVAGLVVCYSIVAYM
jgi:vacuolar protein sorting-associated protein 13A/C